MIVSAVGFVADHLEVLYDLDISSGRRAAGLAFDPARVNDDPAVLHALAQRVNGLITMPTADRSLLSARASPGLLLRIEVVTSRAAPIPKSFCSKTENALVERFTSVLAHHLSTNRLAFLFAPHAVQLASSVVSASNSCHHVSIGRNLAGKHARSLLIWHWVCQHLDGGRSGCPDPASLERRSILRPRARLIAAPLASGLGPIPVSRPAH